MVYMHSTTSPPPVWRGYLVSRYAVNFFPGVICGYNDFPGELLISARYGDAFLRLRGN